MKLYHSTLKALILAPYIFAFSGMLIIPNGDKKMAAFLIIGALASLLYAKLNDINIKEHLREPYFIIILSATLYSIFSYYYHGSSSREIRALLAILIFFTFFPLKKIPDKLLIFVLLLGSMVTFSYSLYYNVFLSEGRWVGHINPIPYSTICALIGIVSYSILLSTSQVIKKSISFLSLVLSIYPLIISQSRGVWLAFIFGFVIVTLTHLKSNRSNNKGIIIFLTISLLLSISGGYFIKSTITDRVNQTLFELKVVESGNLNTSMGLRLQMWSVAPKVMKEKPFFGNGDQHQIIIENLHKRGMVSDSLYNFNPTHYHNQFLDKLVKNGIVGFVIFILIIIYPLTIIKNHSECNKLIIWGGLSVYIFASITDVPFNHPQTLIIFLLILFPLCTKEVKKSHE